jgi:hypothetical protein
LRIGLSENRFALFGSMLLGYPPKNLSGDEKSPEPVSGLRIVGGRHEAPGDRHLGDKIMPHPNWDDHAL